MVQLVANAREVPMQQMSAVSGTTYVIASFAADEHWTNGARRLQSTRLLVVASLLAVATNVATAGDEIFAKICAEREIKVVTLIEDHAEAAFTKPLVETETLSRAGLMQFQAREECYRGRVAEAITLYDQIVTMLGPVLSWRTR